MRPVGFINRLLAVQGVFMAIFELFSKRQKKIRGEVPDVYSYEDIPNPLRVQIVHIIRDTIGQDRYERYAIDAYELIHKTLCKEYGMFTLKKHAKSFDESIVDFFLECEDYEKCLDIIELSFRVINTHAAKNYHNYKQQT
jgi:hypothetical protein